MIRLLHYISMINLLFSGHETSFFLIWLCNISFPFIRNKMTVLSSKGSASTIALDIALINVKEYRSALQQDAILFTREDLNFYKSKSLII